MDAELATLAVSGATTLVALMATDAWNRAKSGLSSLYARFRPDERELLDDQLEHSRAELAAVSDEDRNVVTAELVSEWKGRIRRFLIANPGAVQPLRDILDDLSPAVTDTSKDAATSISMHGEASHGGRIYQQGQGTQINR